ncbi:hypothetical protein ACJX0J_005952 [Zea mays]
MHGDFLEINRSVNPHTIMKKKTEEKQNVCPDLIFTIFYIFLTEGAIATINLYALDQNTNIDQFFGSSGGFNETIRELHKNIILKLDFKRHMIMALHLSGVSGLNQWLILNNVQRLIEEHFQKKVEITSDLQIYSQK